MVVTCPQLWILNTYIQGESDQLLIVEFITDAVRMLTSKLMFIYIARYMEHLLCSVSACQHQASSSCLFVGNRRRLINDDCLEDKTEDYQNYSVLCSVRRLQGAYTMIYMHREQFLIKAEYGLDLGLVVLCLSRLIILCVFLFYLRLFCSCMLFAFVLVSFVSAVSQEICYRKNVSEIMHLFCVELDRT